MEFSFLIFSILASIFPYISVVESHGRLMEPVQRSSIWRLPEFASQNPEPNFNDNELFCGGFKHQHEDNKGKCGECGDPYTVPKGSRDNEGGGKYAKGIIVKNYTKGQVIDIDVELTSSHKGYFEFRICPWNNVKKPEEQSCFDQYLLPLADGSGTKYPIKTFERGHYKTKVKLPASVTCDQCVLQFHYVTGNTWGKCDDGTSAMGCGPQETFRGCADVAIH